MSETIKNYWIIVKHHHIIVIDVQMGEDCIKIGYRNEVLIVATFITLVTNLLENQQGNKSILREKLTRNWTLMNNFFDKSFLLINPVFEYVVKSYL